MPTDHDRELDRLLRTVEGRRKKAEANAPSAFFLHPSSSCPDAETFAAWADGQLTPAEAELVEAHLADCARCQAVMAAFARTEPATAAPAAVVPFRPRPSLKWLVPLAAGTIAATLLVWVSWPSRPEPVEEMAAIDAVKSAPPAAVPSPAAAAPPATSQPEAKLERSKDADATKKQAERRAETPPKSLSQGQQSQTGTTADRSSTIAGLPVTPPPPPQPTYAPPPSPLPAKPALNEAVEIATVIAEFSSADQTDQVRTQTAVQGVAGGGGGGARGGGRGGGGGGRAAGTAAAPPAATFRSAVTEVRWRVKGSGSVERSADLGTSWQPVTIEPNTIRITNGSAPAPSICWLVGRDGAVLLSTDGLKFDLVTPPAPVDLLSISATSARDATVRTADGRTFVTTDGGQTWVVRVPNL